MANSDSKHIPDTRGRPRDEEVDKKVSQIEAAYLKDALPITFFMLTSTDNPKKEAKRLRNSVALKELEDELKVRFRLLARHDGVVVCLQKH